MKRQSWIAGSIVMLAGATVWFLAGSGSQGQERGDAPLIVLYFEENFAGPSLEVTASLADLPVVEDEFGGVIDWNDHVRSVVVVRGTWRLWQHGRSNTVLDATPLEVLDVRTKEARDGWSTLVSASSVAALELPRGAAGGFAQDISSVELVAADNLPDWACVSR